MRTALKLNNITSKEWINFEWPFWLGFLFWSLWPDLRTPKLEILSVPINSKDLIIVLLAYVYIFWPKTKNELNPIIHRFPRWHGYLPFLTGLILLYAAVSVEKSGMDTINTTAMLYTLLVTGATFLLGYLLIAKMPAESVLPFLWRLTVLLAVLGLLYSLASFFSLGFGNVRQSLNSEDQEFGMVRVAGPLFLASKGCFIYIPALALSIQECIRNRSNIILKLIIIFVLTLTIFGLGSRSGLVVVGIFFLFIIFFSKNKKHALISTLMIAVLTAISLSLILSRANPERLKSMEDEARQGTYQTSLQIIMNRNIELNIFGSGYGSYWPWYITDVNLNYQQKGIGIRLIHPFGYMMYHPHSTFLLFTVELGIFGFLYFIYLLITIAGLLFIDNKKIDLSMFKAGIVASSFSMFFDFFLFKEAPTNLLWWIFLFGALSINSSDFYKKNEELQGQGINVLRA
jgi:hypothetical protein